MIPKIFSDKICCSCDVRYSNGKKQIYFHENYTKLTESFLKESSHAVVLTGKINNLTVIDIDDMDWYQEHKFMFEGLTYEEQSFSGKIHLFFQYTDKLPSLQKKKFDILSNKNTCLIGKPLNDLPIIKMPSGVINYIQTTWLKNKPIKEFTELINLIKPEYIKAKNDWLTVGRFMKLHGCSFNDWDEASKKDETGYSKNFTKGVNCMNAYWKSFHTQSTFIKKFNSILHEKKHGFLEELSNLGPGLPIRDLDKSFDYLRLHFGKQIYALSVRNNSTDLSDYLLANGYVSPKTHQVQFLKMNHFDLDDDFYLNDFYKLLTKQGKIYRDGEALLILAKHMHRVIAFCGKLAFIKLSKEEPSKMVCMKYFSDIKICIPSIDRYGEATSLKEFIESKHSFIRPIMSFSKFKMNFDTSYENIDTFYATRHLLAKPIDSGIDISIMLDFIKSIICDNNEEVYDYFMQWIAMIYKFPSVKTCKAIILYSEQHGTGKSTLVNFICNYLLGANNSIENMKYTNLLSDKNYCIADKLFIAINEVASVNSQKNLCSEQLKSLISEESQNFKCLYKENVNVDTSFSLIFCSNNKSCLKITNEDRRYLPIQVSATKKQDTAYFGCIRDTCFNQDFANQFAYHLITLIDHPNTFMRKPIPMTEIKKEMIEESDYLSPFWEYVLDGNVAACKIFKHKKISYHCWSIDALWSVWKAYQVENHYGSMNKHAFTNKLAASKKFEYLRNKEGRYWGIESDKMPKDAIDNLEFDE